LHLFEVHSSCLGDLPQISPGLLNPDGLSLPVKGGLGNFDVNPAGDESDLVSALFGPNGFENTSSDEN